MFKADNGLKFDTLQVTEKSHLENNPSKPSCNLSIQYVYPVESRKVNLEELQQLFIECTFGHSYAGLPAEEVIKQYTANYVENYRTDAQAFSSNVPEPVQEPANHTVFDELVLDEDDESRQRPDVFYSYYETLSDSIVYNRNNILSFQVKQSNNKGGSTSYESFKNYVVNLKTGKLLTENDIFMAGYDVQLRMLFISALLDQNKMQRTDDLADLGYFGIEEITPNKNFLIDNKGITYTFNKGEYSAYQLSAPVVFLPYDAVRPFLRENTVVSKLAGN